ncbi:phosphodiester glycosidase family protein [Candidatus Woesebacteria bacterium]|nr:phosphodiester glycosidase family protein [Candidatus Woesebacteria bacterium]
MNRFRKGVVSILPVLVVLIIVYLLGYKFKNQLPSFFLRPTPTESASSTPTDSSTPSPTPTPVTIKTPTPKPVTTISPAPVISNAPPGAGYSRQSVSSDAGVFTVSMIAADISSTRVIVDTASPGDCSNNCPVLSLGDYVVRNGAYAGINGSYFCPADYSSCSGKTNTFDTLLMNKDKVYFNSANNVYSNNPAVIFGGGYIRFVGAASEWGRDTGIDSMISNYPLLLAGGNITFGGDDDPKKGSKGSRSFVANKGNNVYIGVVHSATVAESARVMKALGFENALNLDNGGSTALYSGGYKVGPGRALPNVILFVKR